MKAGPSLLIAYRLAHRMLILPFASASGATNSIFIRALAGPGRGMSGMYILIRACFSLTIKMQKIFGFELKVIFGVTSWEFWDLNYPLYLHLKGFLVTLSF